MNVTQIGGNAFFAAGWPDEDALSPSIEQDPSEGEIAQAQAQAAEQVKDDASPAAEQAQSQIPYG